MIEACRTEILQKTFPDGSLLIKPPSGWKVTRISWLFENNAELWTLIALTRHYQNQGCEVELYMPYCPNSRQDRVKNDYDVFTLKYFCEVINSLKFTRVIVRDAHSNVMLALLDNVVQESIERPISTAIDTSKPNILFFPDEGSQKRYASDIGMPFMFGIKKRDWETGKHLGLDVIGNVPENPFDVLIIDDICSKGGTFYYSAVKLKELGANNIDLYVTHCENAILSGEFTEKKIPLLETGLIRNVFTTPGIFTGEHPQIKVIGEKI